MIARAAATALAALCLLAAIHSTQAQPAWVEVTETTTEEPEETEKRYTPELVEELESAKADAMLLYTEFTARAAHAMNQFLRNISGVERSLKSLVDPGLLEEAPEQCRASFTERVRKVRYTAHSTALFSGVNHHKFFLGHMIVFRMHLNKSEEYVNKCDKIISTCGILCETQPRIRRWRRMAADELHRVRDDLEHSRNMYRDLLTHAQRRLNSLRKRLAHTVAEEVERFKICAKGGALSNRI